ncbi:MAG: glycosyltransferase family 2 protein [Paludibacteraceae bacterium]|nr:glycosyltransferase family 2 protein [Paludibacteraceae bacterium]
MSIYNYSVILPYRDKYKLFLKAIDSIPDRDDIQVIVVDNSIVPLTKDQIPAKSQAHVDYFNSSTTKGAGCARNVGLKHVKGRYIVFLDADDYFTTEAFPSFDKYLEKGFDIVFFRTDSINLIDSSRSNRHETINQIVSSYQVSGNEDLLRYKFVNPIAKMLQSEFVIRKGIQFDEIPVSNDMWFSIMTGHAAKKVTADDSVVYMITAGDTGSSLTRMMTKENWFIRYQVQIKINKFLKSVNKYKYRIRLLGGLRIAWKEFGFKAFLHFLKYTFENRIGIF